MFIVLDKAINEVGAHVLFLMKIIRVFFTQFVSVTSLSEQIWKISINSVITTAFAGFFVGAIMTIQFTLQVQQFGALGYLGGLATSATIRELGPLLIAFMLSGKVGAFTSAEIGTMKVTEQIDALRCLGVDPIREVILPRFLAIIISSFVLLIIGLVMSFYGGALMGRLFAGINYDEYIRNIPRIVTGFSIVVGLIKCFYFSLLLAVICTYQGYNTTGGAKGVGRTVIKTAVYTMMGIVVLDWLTSFIFDILILL